MSKVYTRYRQRGPEDEAGGELTADGLGHYGRPLLEVEDLKVYFGSHRHPIRAVDGVSFMAYEGECLGLVGESGCGKSTLGRAVLRLEKPTSGRVRFAGKDVLRLEGDALQRYREQAQMIFQDPYGSLNPRLSIGGALTEVMSVHKRGQRRDRKEMAGTLLESVGLDAAYMDRYPHEFSGGQRQRIGIARALAVDPSMLIADEPVSALDVSVQVQILNLMKDLQRQHGLTYLFVAHDLAVVRYICDRILVMYLGRIVESGSAERLYARPAHPYTQALLASVPDVDRGLQARGKDRRRAVLKGDVPSPSLEIKGCPFHTRCPHATDECRERTPSLRTVAPGHQAACHYAERFLGPAQGTAFGVEPGDEAPVAG